LLPADDFSSLARATRPRERDASVIAEWDGARA